MAPWPPGCTVFVSACLGVLASETNVVSGTTWTGAAALGALALLAALLRRRALGAVACVATACTLASLALACAPWSEEDDGPEADAPGPVQDARNAVVPPLTLVRVLGPVFREATVGMPARLRVRVTLLAVRDGSAWRTASGTGRVWLVEAPLVGDGDVLGVRLQVAPLRPQAAPWRAAPERQRRRTGDDLRLVAHSGHVAWGPPARPSIAHVTDVLRQRWGMALDASLPPAAAAAAKALALGDATSLLPAQRDAWSDAGIAHLLAVSGLHVSLVARAARRACWSVGWHLAPRAARLGRLSWAAAVGGSLAAWGYAALTGCQVAAVRAATMASLVQLGAALGCGRGHAWNALGLAGTALLLRDPQALFAPSFLLSFVAVAALLTQVAPGPPADVDDCTAAGFPPQLSGGRLRRQATRLARAARAWAQAEPEKSGAAVRQRNARRHAGAASKAPSRRSVHEAAAARPLRAMRQRWHALRPRAASAVAAAATHFAEACTVAAATAPLSAAYFGTLPTYAPWVNLLAVPWGSLVCTPLALAMVAAQPLARVVPALDAPLAALTGWALGALDALAHGAAALPGACFMVVPPPTVVWAPASAAALLASWGCSRVRRPGARAALSAALLGAVAALLLTWPARDTGGGVLRLWHVDVGHGDATLVQFPDGRWLLVDGGGALYPNARYDPGRAALGPALRALGVRRLHAVLLTHPHPDHFGGLFYVVGRLRVDALWLGEDAREAAAVRALAAGVRARGGKVGPPPTELRWGGVTLETRAALAGQPASANDHGVVVRLRYGSTSALLAADVEARGEADLLPWLGPVDVLKVAHHGSPTSTTSPWVARLQPQLAVVSCGEASRFGFPHPDVVARLRAAGTWVRDTGQHGTVALSSDGRAWQVRWGAQGPRQRRVLTARDP